MKQVKILKDGEAHGTPYKKGEIWKFLHYYSDHRFCSVENMETGKKSQVTVESVNPYGLEAEIIEEEITMENKEVNIQLW